MGIEILEVFLIFFCKRSQKDQFGSFFTSEIMLAATSTPESRASGEVDAASRGL